MLQKIAFIGDLHLASKKPGRRLDDYSQTIINKLKQIETKCIANKAQPVLVGDVFHRGDENNLVFLNELFSFFANSPLTWLSNCGNHDINNGTRLDDKHALSLFLKANLIKVFTTIETYPILLVNENIQQQINLTFVPWTEEIPLSLPEKENDSVNFLITHHDISFDGNSYPELIDPVVINNCNFLINGHIHKEYPPIELTKEEEKTTWINVGSIARVAINEMKNKPFVLFYDVKDGFNKEYLEIEESVFDMTGYQVQQATEDELLSSGEFVREKETVNLIYNAFDGMGARKTDDASVLKEFLTEKVEKVSNQVAKEIIWELFDKAVEK
jgi:predicted phosphodiesterase